MDAKTKETLNNVFLAATEVMPVDFLFILNTLESRLLQLKQLSTTRFIDLNMYETLYHETYQVYQRLANLARQVYPDIQIRRI